MGTKAAEIKIKVLCNQLLVVAHVKLVTRIYTPLHSAGILIAIALANSRIPRSPVVCMHEANLFPKTAVVKRW